MSNFLKNGAVLPYGLLGENTSDAMAGFNRTYRNTPLRMGIVIRSIPNTDPTNVNRLEMEYDVEVIEQNEDKGSSVQRYRNCISTDGLGSIADFFERTLRQKQTQGGRTYSTTRDDQDGAIVAILCLDGVSEKAVIIGGFTHPERKTTLVDVGPHLEGEFNGVHVVINEDGSCSFTVKGATDNSGKVIGETNTVTVGVDSGKNITIGGPGNFTLNIVGNVALTSTGNTTVSCADATVTATGTATIEGTNVKLGAAASESVIKGDTFKKYFDMHIHPTALGPSEKPLQPMPASTLSTKVKTE